MTIIKKKHGPIDYFLKGSDPKLLILTGMHGDESEIIHFVSAHLKKHQSTLPDFLFIPEVSPTAVKQKTRKNAWGRDVNRCFIDHPLDPEAAAVMDILKPYHFSLCLNIHEDPDLTNDFYLYDSGTMTDGQLQAYRERIRGLSILPYTGMDDPADKDLGMLVTDGYVKTHAASHKEDGFSSTWMIMHYVALRVLVPEVPGKALLTRKKALVSELFSLFAHQPLS